MTFPAQPAIFFCSSMRQVSTSKRFIGVSIGEMLEEMQGLYKIYHQPCHIQQTIVFVGVKLHSILPTSVFPSVIFPSLVDCSMIGIAVMRSCGLRSRTRKIGFTTNERWERLPVATKATARLSERTLAEPKEFKAVIKERDTSAGKNKVHGIGNAILVTLIDEKAHTSINAIMLKTDWRDRRNIGDGQLYVVVSRVKIKKGFKILCCNKDGGYREANVVLMNSITLFRLEIGSSVGRNDGTTSPESSYGNTTGDLLHMVVVVEEMCRIVVVEELSKAVDDTMMDCTEVVDCCSMEEDVRYQSSKSLLKHVLELSMPLHMSVGYEHVTLTSTCHWLTTVAVRKPT
ncbi:hypothetical protein Tco_0537775 [Tanacetum coccineum]